MKEASIGSSKALVLEGWDDETDSDKISRWLEALEEGVFDNFRGLSVEREGSTLQENVVIDGNLVDSDMIEGHEGSVTERFQMVAAMIRHADKRKRDEVEETCPPTPSSSVVFIARIRKDRKYHDRKERNIKHSGRKTVSSVSEKLQPCQHREEKRPRLVLKGKSTQAEGDKDDQEIPSGEHHYVHRVDTRHPKKRRTKGKPLTLTYIKQETPSRNDDGSDSLEKIEEKSLVCPSIESINEEEKERFVRYRKGKADLLDARSRRKSTQGKGKLVGGKKRSDRRAPHKDDFFTNDYHYHGYDYDYNYSMNDEEPLEVDEEEAPWFDQVCTFIPTASNKIDFQDDIDDDGLDDGVDGCVEVDHTSCPYLCHRLCGDDFSSCSKTCDVDCKHSRNTSDEPFDQTRYGEGKGIGKGLIADANLYNPLE